MNTWLVIVVILFLCLVFRKNQDTVSKKLFQNNQLIVVVFFVFLVLVCMNKSFIEGLDKCVNNYPDSCGTKLKDVFEANDIDFTTTTKRDHRCEMHHPALASDKWKKPSNWKDSDWDAFKLEEDDFKETYSSVKQLCPCDCPN
jgi:hypothetical protein